MNKWMKIAWYAWKWWPLCCKLYSERIGWIPLEDEISNDVRKRYNFLYGLSVTEMEIMHAAYRLDNPNGMI